MNPTIKNTAVPPCVDCERAARRLLLELLAMMEENHVDQVKAE
jgi:hypothetical protein